MRIKLIFTLAALFFKSIHCCAHTHLEVKSEMSSTCRFKIWQRILFNKKKCCIFAAPLGVSHQYELPKLLRHSPVSLASLFL